MSEHLIINNDNDNDNDNDQDILMKEIKKMSFIRYLNLLNSICRFFLMIFLILLIAYFPASFRPTIFTIILMLYIMLIQSLLTIYFLIIIISGTIKKDFWIRKKSFKCGVYTCICCCCIMSKNIFYLRIISIISTIISFFWSLFLLYYFIKDFSIPNNGIFFPLLQERTIKRIIFNFIDSFLLLIQSYYFHYNQYFLSRIDKYLEYYKRLIIKNKNEEANLIRKTLPTDIDNYVSSNETELQNV